MTCRYGRTRSLGSKAEHLLDLALRAAANGRTADSARPAARNNADTAAMKIMWPASWIIGNLCQLLVRRLWSVV